MKSSVQTKVRLGKIFYLNSYPYYCGLDETKEFEFYESSPAGINLAMREGRVDIAPISSFEYLLNQKDYLLLPDISIGATEFSGSVLLLSRVKLEELNGKHIALTEESLSSQNLLKILLHARYQFKNTFEEVPSSPNQMLSKYEASLLIGNDALFFQPESMIYQYDLAELWNEWTQKSFCFAVWAVRREFAEANKEEVQSFAETLKAVCEKNLSDVEMLVQYGLNIPAYDPRYPKVLNYLSNLQYQFDAEMKQGLEHFFRLAYDQGLAPEPKSLETI